MKLRHMVRQWAPSWVLERRHTVARSRNWGLPDATTRKLAVDPSRMSQLEGSGLMLLPASSLPKIRTVIDVGANVGAWLSTVVEYCHPERALALEPVPDTFGELARLPALRDPRIRLVQKAVGNTLGTVEMNLLGAHQNHSILAADPTIFGEYGVQAPKTGKVTVPITTLDHEVGDWDEVSLLKIDVQGFEKQVLEGAKQTLKKTHAVLMEALLVHHYEGDTLFGELQHLMSSVYGFEVHDVSNPFRNASGRGLWLDVLYVRSGSSFLQG